MKYSKCASRILGALAGVLITSMSNPCYATGLASSDLYVSARFPAGDTITGYSEGRPANPQPYVQVGSNAFQNPDGGDGLANGFVGVFASSFGAGGLATNYAAKTSLDVASQFLEYSAFGAATAAAAVGTSAMAVAVSQGNSQELVVRNSLDTDLFLAVDLTYRFVLYSIHGEGHSTALAYFALEESSNPSDPSVIFSRSFKTSGSAFDSCGLVEPGGTFEYLSPAAGLDGGRCQWTVPVWIQLAPAQIGVYRLSTSLVDVAEVPEPATLFLAGFGLCCLAACLRCRGTKCGMWVAFVTAALAGSTARAESPDFVYGRCGGPTTGYAKRADLVRRAGRSLDRVVSIDVISCGHTDSTGGVQEAQCPSGLPYSYCLRDQSDGQNNTITVGVIDDARPPALYSPRSPWAYYSGCGGTRGRLADLLTKLGVRAASAHAIDILECGRSRATQRVGLAPCPKGSTYSYCILADSDGLGNRIKVGVLDAGADPAGFYGPCAVGATAKRKTDLIWNRGSHAMNVWRASVVSCGPANGAPVITSATCPAGLSASYCLSTANDGAGNSVTLAFWERQDDDPLGYVGGTLTTAGYHMRVVYPDGLGGRASDVAAIRTISASPYSGPGATHYTACPIGSTYDYCVENQNDGLGNHVVLGIWNKKWPGIYDLYGRCRFMAERLGDQLVSRQLEILKAGQTPFHVLGVEVLSCESIGSKFDLNQARVVPCPAGPWSYCVENDNDGAGNKVMLGVVNW